MVADARARRSVLVAALQQTQQGQALVEFLVLCFALVPLLVLIPMLGKYQDMGHAAQMASRYAAFDATIRNGSMSTEKPPAQLADEVRRRFFGAANVPIKTDDVAGDFLAHRNLFWRDPQGNALVKNFSDITVSFGKDKTADRSRAFEALALEEGFFTTARLAGLPTPGIYRANIAVKVANLPAKITSYQPFDTLNLTIERSTSLLIDPWAAKNTDQVNQRVRQWADKTALPLRVIEPALRILVPALDNKLPGISTDIKTPRFVNLESWTDLVPPDRF